MRHLSLPIVKEVALRFWDILKVHTIWTKRSTVHEMCSKDLPLLRCMLELSRSSEFCKRQFSMCTCVRGVLIKRSGPEYCLPLEEWFLIRCLKQAKYFMLFAGNFPERLCEPMAKEIQKFGGEIKTKARLSEIVLNEDDSVKHFRMQDGSTIEGDLYVSAMPGKIFNNHIH